MTANLSFIRLFRASLTPCLMLAPDAPCFTVRDANDAYLAATLRTREDLVGRALADAFPPDPGDPAAIDTLRASLERALAARGPDEMPVRMHAVARPDGTLEERWWRAHNTPVLDADGAVEAILHHVSDETERRRADAALRASEARFRTALEIETVGAIYFDLDGRLIDANDAFLDMAGYGRDDLEAGRLTWQKLTPPEWLEPSHRAFAELKATGRTTPYEKEYLRKDGSRFWALFAAKLLPGGIGFEFVLDITARKQAEHRRLALVEFSDRIRDTRDPDDLAYAAAEILGRTLQVSRAGYGTIDTAAETITIRRDWNAPGIESLAGVLHFRDYGSYIEDLKRGKTVVFADAETDPRTAARAHALKAISAQSVVNMPVTERGGFVALLYLNHATARAWSKDELALIREVAERTRTAIERLRAEAELRALNETLEARVAERTLERDRMWNTSPDLMLVIDFAGYLRRVNPAWTTMLGYAADELIGRHVNEFVLPDDRQETVRAYEFAAHGGRPAIVNRYRHKDGSIRWISWTAAPAGDMTYATGRDITAERTHQAELEVAQEQLRQSQKLEAIGQLTSGVAHDFNNLLTAVLGNIEIAGDFVTDGNAQRFLESAAGAARRGANLIQQLLAFSRKQRLAPEAIDLNGLVTGASDMLFRTIGATIRIESILSADVWPVLADPTQVEMVLLNLAINARDAMPEGGRITIRTANVPAGRAPPDLTRQDYVLVSLADTGTGMSEDTLRKAVDPFFTTKDVGKGSGLGLSMVAGVATQSGGGIAIESKLGRGTTVTIFLPRATAAARGTPSVGVQHPPAERRGKVLVVDDDADVRALTVNGLLRAGYDVREAPDGATALQLLASMQPVDLVVVDVAMPGMNGVEFVRRARQQIPALRALMVTGYADAAMFTDGVRDAILQKPFRLDRLAEAVAAAISSDVVDSNVVPLTRRS